MIAHLQVEVDPGPVAAVLYGPAKGCRAGGDRLAAQSVGPALLGLDGLPVVKYRQLQRATVQHFQHIGGLSPGLLRGYGLGEEVHPSAQPRLACPGIVGLKKGVLLQISADIAAKTAAQHGEIDTSRRHLLPLNFLLPLGHIHPLAGGVGPAGIGRFGVVLYKVALGEGIHRKIRNGRDPNRPGAVIHSHPAVLPVSGQQQKDRQCGQKQPHSDPKPPLILAGCSRQRPAPPHRFCTSPPEP